jgi:hypothetical protein
MKLGVRFFVGLAASIVIVGSVFAVVILSYTLIKEGIASRGNVSALEIRLRHYTDTLTIEEDGTLRMNQSSHPLGRMLLTASRRAAPVTSGTREPLAGNRSINPRVRSTSR